jgi:hypothetical protein
MSETEPAPAPAPPPVPTPPAPGPAASWFAHLEAAIQHGASMVYHDAVSLVATAAQWKTAHPAIGEVITEGLGYARDFALRMGVPADAITIIEQDIEAALKRLAALDATVHS